MADVVKRVHYFDHQFLHVGDFETDQDYHRGMRHRHNRLLHTPGIAEGFDVSKVTNLPTQVKVTAGTAFDKNGVEVVRANDGNFDLTSQLAVAPATSRDLYLVIGFDQKLSDPTTETGGAGQTRWTEDPALQVLANPPDAQSANLLLAKITLSQTAVTAVDPSGRRMAGAVAGDLSVPSVTLQAPGVESSKWVRLAGTAANESTLTGSLAIAKRSAQSTDGNLTIGGRLGVRTTTPQAELDVRGAGRVGSLAIVDVASGNPLAGASIGVVDGIGSTPAAKWLQLGGLIDGGSQRLLLKAEQAFLPGRLGIGVADPTHSLHVTDPSGIRQNQLVVSGDAGGQSFSYNAFRSAGGWAFLDTARTAVTLEMDDAAGPSRFEVWSTTIANTTAWVRRFRIDGDGGDVTMAVGGGNVGIATDSPQRKLHVEGTEIHVGGAGAGFSFADRASTGLTDAPGERWVWYSASNVARLWSGATDLVAISASGSVGIATDNPQRRLHVEGDEIHSGGANSGFSFADRGATALTNVPGERWVWFSNNKAARLWSGGVDHMTVTTDGNIRWARSMLSADQGGSIELGGSTGGVPGAETPYIDFHHRNLNQDFNVRLMNNLSGQLTIIQGAALPGTGIFTSEHALAIAGKAKAVAWESTSDKRLKKNVRGLTGVLDRVRELEGVRFEWKRSATKAAGLMADSPAGVGPQIGLLADQVGKHFPELVSESTGADGKSYAALDYGRVSAVLVEAVKELADRVDALAARIER